ncbi:tRNA threonylcarbamoyladenosine dehydratase [Psychrobacter sp. I-STPA10]|uniref:tRNA threonylcarbamoyladenosine dehydratase n=1 Tax=Psychrobacter sp. I-STPA10 TaxID=2585769 RepID=UPI001E2893D2|nr:tRNA threonylcarbamoyladenosine dehydratase [Psychrobacter sp. I-STPA10]
MTIIKQSIANIHQSQSALPSESASNPPDSASQYQRRFAGTQRLYGQVAFTKFTQAHVYVIGVGGVGTWVAEGLARTGVGQITLIDLDVLVASNVNRQLPALDSTFGRSKIEVMAERIQQINPCVTVHLIDDFLTENNVDVLLPSRDQAKQAKQTKQSIVVLDCTDDMAAKLAIAMHCRFNKLKLICAGGAGGKTDPLQVTVSDLKDSYQDPLLARLRSKLRHEKNINTQMKEKFGIKCVYSTQPPITTKSAAMGATCEQPSGQSSKQQGGLHCGGYGSAVAVTATVAMVMVSEALALL